VAGGDSLIPRRAPATSPRNEPAQAPRAGSFVSGRVPGQPAPGGGSVVGDAVGVGVGLAVGDGDAVGLGVRAGDVGVDRGLVGLLDGCSFGSQATPSPSRSSSVR